MVHKRGCRIRASGRTGKGKRWMRQDEDEGEREKRSRDGLVLKMKGVKTKTTKQDRVDSLDSGVVTSGNPA